MLAIRKCIDSFEILTERGQVLAPTVKNLLQVMEKELDINIFDEKFQAQMDDLDDTLENLQVDVAKIEERLKAAEASFSGLKKEAKDKS